MRAGPLRHKVTVQARGPQSTDEGWGETQAWRDVLTTFASIEPLRGSERVETQAVRSEVTHRVRMRYHPEVQGDHRLITPEGFGTFDIVSLINVKGRRCLMELECKAHG